MVDALQGAGQPTRRGGLWVTAVVMLTAYVARLVPVLRGTGLLGPHGYDGSVYYAGAAGLAHGLLPYRDFLFLHPPGITLALLPFAALGRVVGDAQAMAAATLVWFGLGALNAALVSRIVRPLGLWPALLSGLFYAVFFPAVFIERAPLLEAPAATLTLGAVLLLCRRGTDDPRLPLGRAAIPGLLVGMSAGLKIWGIVTVLAVLGWVGVTYGLRRAAAVAVGAVVGVTAICLPFFVSAPAAMWRMVVVDQVSRPASGEGVQARLVDIVGLPVGTSLLLLIAVLAVLVAGCALAARSRAGQLSALLVGSDIALLLATPSWFEHYAGLTAAPGAVLLGAGCARLGHLVPFRRVRALLMTLALAGLVGTSLPAFSSVFGGPFPRAELAAAGARTTGCITTDDPASLIQTNLFAQNFQRHCPLVVDLGGYSYDLRPASSHPRDTNPVWQRFALDYLRTGSLTILIRFHAGSGFDPQTAAEVHRWPVVARAGRIPVRRPVAATS